MIDQLLKSEYLKNIATLMGGSISAQLILLLISPILTHLFTPTDFGIFALFVAISTILGMIANGRYEAAILLPDKDEEGFQIFQLCLTIASIFSFVTFFALLGLRNFDWFERSSINNYWWLLPIAIFIQGALQAFTGLLNRNKNYNHISKGRLWGGVGIAATSITFGIWAFGALGLILGKLVGQFIELWVYFNSTSFNRFTIFKRKPLLSIARKYSNFLKFSTFEGLLNTFFKQIPVFGLTTFFGIDGQGLAGNYDLAQKVLGKPVGIVGSSIGKVFFQKVAKINHETPDAIRPFFLKNLRNMFWLVLPSSVLIMLLSPTLFPIIFGKNWSQAGIYASWLMPFFAVTFLKAPLSSIIDIKNKLKENLVFEVGFVLISIFAFWFGLKNQNALNAIQIFSLGNALLGLLQLWWFYTLTKSKDKF